MCGSDKICEYAMKEARFYVSTSETILLSTKYNLWIPVGVAQPDSMDFVWRTVNL